MNLFGIGTSEFIIIFILALMILGPERLPRYANILGRKLREWRMMSQVFLVEWKEELAALEEARQSLDEARQALLEAQETVTTEVSEVTNTVSAEVKGAQQDISKEMAETQQVVSAEQAQIKDTVSRVRKGEADQTMPLAAGVSNTIAPPQQTIASPEEASADEDAPETGDTTETTSVEENDISDISDVVEIDDGIDEIITEETPVAPPVAAPVVDQASALDEVDVAGMQTVSDVAEEVAQRIATQVAKQVARQVTRDVTSNMAEEVAALVMAQLAKSGINITENGATAAVESTQPDTSPQIQEVVNE